MKKLLIGTFLLLLGFMIYLRVNPQLPAQNTQSNIKQTPNQNQNTTDEPAVTTIADNLSIPWALTFLPDGTILFTEREGRVRMIDTNGNLSQQAVLEISEVAAVGEGGLLGIARHPEFEESPFIYVYYTYSSQGKNQLNRVVRYRYASNQLTQPTTIIDRIPGASNHDGGRIKFGPDNHLYIGTGDAQEPSLAQNTNSLAGKILRVTDEGKVPSDNPFNNPVYSYGHRNVQGLAWDNNGNLWATEHGRSGIASGYDELNLIERGKNYGWPDIEGDETQSGMVAPKQHSGSSATWAPSGMAFVNGSLFFSGLRGAALYESEIQNNQANTVTEHFKNEYGRIRDVVVSPDGMLYITTSNRDGRGNPESTDDRIIRINPRAL